MTVPIFEVRDVTYRYHEATALDGLNLTVLRGQRIVLLGANGSGKSTLLRIVAGGEGAFLVCSFWHVDALLAQSLPAFGGGGPHFCLGAQLARIEAGGDRVGLGDHAEQLQAARDRAHARHAQRDAQRLDRRGLGTDDVDVQAVYGRVDDSDEIAELERMNELNGKFELRSNRRGTIVRATVPQSAAGLLIQPRDCTLGSSCASAD